MIPAGGGAAVAHVLGRVKTMNAAPQTTCASNSKPPAASTDERTTVKNLIEGLLLKHEAKHWPA